MEIIIFIIGLILGVLFYKIGLYLPINKDITKKLTCDKCNSELNLLEKIPILSYFYNKVYVIIAMKNR